MKHLALFAVFILPMSQPAMAQVYKCNGSSGATVVQDLPCAGSGASVREEIRAREASQRRNQELADRADANTVSTRSNQGLAPEAQARVDAQVAKWKAEAAADEIEAKKVCGAGGVVDLPVIGMSEQRMLQCTTLGRGGAFTLVNTLEVPGAVTRQYESLTSVKFVYTRNGVVTGIQR